jgi:hypothetical protein
LKTVHLCISWGIKKNFDNIKMQQHGMYVKTVYCVFYVNHPHVTFCSVSLSTSWRHLGGVEV